jgi:nitrous oxidase accessory protein
VILATAAMLAVLGATPPATASDTIVVPPTRGALAAAVAAAVPGRVLVVAAGRHEVAGIVVRVPLTLVGRGWPVLDAGEAGTVLTVAADDVTVQGLEFRRTGTAYTEDRAGIRVTRAHRCAILGNRMREVMVGVYLDSVATCRVEDNDLQGLPASQLAAGNGVHAWNSHGLVVRGNRVTGHRDGIYFEFITEADVEDNVVTGSHRYGLHFMFSHDLRYRGNTFARNASGIAVMYSKRVTIARNRFVDNMGPAAYGLLLKDIDDSRLEGNAFERNSVGVMIEGGTRNAVHDNRFEANGWGVRIMANAVDNTFTANTFAGNAFDVGTNSRSATSTFTGNTWDRYAGYDLDRDGVGDVPHLPVKLFAVLVEQSPVATMLLRSLFVDLLDVAERAFPVLTPDEWRDPAPRMPGRAR